MEEAASVRRRGLALASWVLGLIAAILLLAAFAHGQQQAYQVQLTGTLAGANGVPASNSLINLTPSQFFYIPNSNTTVPVDNIYGNGTPTNPCVIEAQFYTDISVSPYALWQCIGGVWVHINTGGGGGGTLTSFGTGSWPSWLTPSVTNPTTTPVLAVSASPIPNSALQHSGFTYNGGSISLGDSFNALASLNALTGPALNLTSTGATVSITPSGSSIDLEAVSTSGPPTILSAGDSIVAMIDSRGYVDDASTSPISVTAYSSTGTVCTITTGTQALTSASSIQLYGTGWPAGWLTTNGTNGQQIYPVVSATSTSVVFACGQSAGSGSISGGQIRDATATWPIQISKTSPVAAKSIVVKSQVSFASPGNTTLSNFITDIGNGVYPSCATGTCYVLIVPPLYDFWQACSGVGSISTYETNLQTVWTDMHALGYKVIQTTQFPDLGTSAPPVCSQSAYTLQALTLNNWIQTQNKSTAIAANPAATAYWDSIVDAEAAYTDAQEQSYLQSATVHHFADPLHGKVAGLFAGYFASGADAWRRNTCGNVDNCGALTNANVWTGTNNFNGSSQQKVQNSNAAISTYEGYDSALNYAQYYANSAQSITTLGSFGSNTFPKFSIYTIKVFSSTAVGVMLHPNTILGWSPTQGTSFGSVSLASSDVGFSREAAGILDVGNGITFNDTSGTLKMTAAFIAGLGSSNNPVCTTTGGQLKNTGCTVGTPSPLTTKGDIWVYSTTDARLPVGTDTFILSADSSQATGLKWIAQPSGTFSAGGDLSGTSSSQTVIGLKTVPFCTGYTPTNGQAIEYTTGGSPNPCYTATTITGGGNVSNSGSPSSGDIASWVNATTIKTATNTEVNTLIKTLTGCNTVGNVYTPQAADCVAPSGSTPPYVADWVGVTNVAGSVASITSAARTIQVGDLVTVWCRSGGAVTSDVVTSSVANTWNTTSIFNSSTNNYGTINWSLIGTGGSSTFTCTPNTSVAGQSMAVMIIRGATPTLVGSAGTSSTSSLSYLAANLAIAPSGRSINVICATVSSLANQFFGPNYVNGIPGQIGTTASATSLVTASEASCGFVLDYQGRSSTTMTMSYGAPIAGWAEEAISFTY